MNALKESERITLAEGLALLERHVPTEKAKARLRQYFIQRDLIHSQLPIIALPYNGAEIDWATGSVKIPKQKARFCPTFLQADFSAHFFEDHTARLTLRAGKVLHPAKFSWCTGVTTTRRTKSRVS